MHRRIHRNIAGFTLIEMLVSMTIGMVVIAGVTGTFTIQTRQNKAEEEISQMHQNVRGAVDLISRELMQAGFKPSGAIVTGVTYNANASQLLIQADIDGSGAIDPTDNATIEYIIYAWDSATRRITRQLGAGGTPEIVADNITACVFSYQDASGGSTTTSSLIRKVNINITGRTARIDPSFPNNGGYRTYQLSVDVAPPNLAL
jgi:type IV pilus assembly protein PilW